ncbi:hypothetical protein NBH00_16990 [Paraconexibacter antarcticus]|uniref:Cellulase (Glycosyl hydrolase family 5) n=1 Tax=Paraconexibacter antarcticus TaxID=2949664 RepID=A0ABY5DN69_9ACTN|nr:hypothetical protein [Paraconexibacter antarcticus]UTI63049.1 hypothetical protein NBH00_16990 [Paraconexibacter antarcticus]
MKPVTSIRTGRRAAAPALALVLAAILLGAGLGRPALADASRTQRTLFEAPRELLGPDQALRTRTLAELRSLGVRDLRIVLYWKDVAPDPGSRSVPGFHERDPAAYDWGHYAPAIDQAAAAGLRVLLTVTGPVPRWATAARRDQVTRPSPQHYQRFFEAVARRFGAEVDRFSVWNEPNHPAFLMPQFVHGHAASGAIYRRLYVAARRGLKAAGRSRQPLLFGETAPRGTSHVVAPLRFLRQALCLTSAYHRRRSCRRLSVTAVAHHPYTTKAGPSFVPPDRDDVTIGVLHRLSTFLARAERARALTPGTRIALTEFGIQSRPDPYVGVSLTRQAAYRARSEQLAYEQPRVDTFAQYLLRDDDPRPGPAASRYSGFESGLRTSAGAAKPAYAGFRLPLVARRSGRGLVSLWGLVRPAAAATTVTIDVLDRGEHQWHTLKHVRTSSRGWWRSRTRRTAGRRYRVRWTDQAGVT